MKPCGCSFAGDKFKIPELHLMISTAGYKSSLEIKYKALVLAVLKKHNEQRVLVSLHVKKSQFEIKF